MKYAFVFFFSILFSFVSGVSGSSVSMAKETPLVFFSNDRVFFSATLIIALKTWLDKIPERMEPCPIENRLIQQKISRDYKNLIGFRPLEAVVPEKATIYS
ncbi:MAG: hypothetical protein V6Z89_17940 [Desulfobacter sp.]